MNKHQRLTEAKQFTPKNPTLQTEEPALQVRHLFTMGVLFIDKKSEITDFGSSGQIHCKFQAYVMYSTG